MIVGAGQSGLQLALSLQKRGYTVSVTSNRSPDDIRTGKGAQLLGIRMPDGGRHFIRGAASRNTWREGAVLEPPA